MGKRRRFYINIWDGCNLNCKHCFNYSGKAEGKLLSASEVIRLIAEAQEYLGIEEVQLTGGEPVQRPDIFIIIRNLLKRGVKILLQTNGVFDTGIREEILKIPEDRLSLIISLDGIETNDYFRGQGITGKIIENIEILSQKFQIRINTLLSSKIKWDEVERLAQIAKKLGLSLAFNPVCPSGRADPSLLMPPNKYFEWMYGLEDLRQQGVRIRKCFDFIDRHMVETEECPVRKGVGAVHVCADGETYPCGFLVNNPLCSLGSVRDFSLIELRERVPSYCKSLAPECRECELYIKGYCHGGCPARIYALYKRFDVVDIYCMAKYFQEGRK
jgi:radical SAM protein with 4Fe4S-binding SPASM domain